MTDIDTIRNILRAAGIGFREGGDPDGDRTIEFYAGDAKVDGYAGFNTCLTFARGGNLGGVGLWE